MQYHNLMSFSGKKPNTYTFSKALAEDLVMKQCQDLPTAIVRPSIGNQIKLSSEIDP